MQILVLITLLVAAPQGILSKVATTKKQLPAPKDSKLILFDPPGIIIKWKPVQSDLEPVLGYKVRIWEPRDTEFIKLIGLSPHNSKLHEYLLTGANHSQMTFNNIKVDMPYQLQVLAFGASGDGEPTSQVQVQMRSTW